ncbi:MAG TPA: hypothetical protein VE775_09865 [Pyrinomonadaceae bacterium]|nr:hypothetical protein [Pyrinomonadaceae bacterium]
MSWMDQIGGLLQQYTGAAQGQAPNEVHDHFDQVAQTAPPSVLANGLAAAFRSDQTPAFGQMLGQMFGQSNNQQRAGILNTLVGALGPTVVSQVLQRQGASGLAGLLGGGQAHVSPDAAAQVSPEAVAELAAHAEQKDPSIIDTVSNFYAEHPTLVKGLGAAALGIAMSRIASGLNR